MAHFKLASSMKLCCLLACIVMGIQVCLSMLCPFIFFIEGYCGNQFTLIQFSIVMPLFSFGEATPCFVQGLLHAL